jgi:hypothetical protein
MKVRFSNCQDRGKVGRVGLSKIKTWAGENVPAPMTVLTLAEQTYIRIRIF